MNTIPPSTIPAAPGPYSAATPSGYPTAPRCRRTASWAAIFAGFTVALALQVLFMLLGAGLGFAIYNPLTNDNPVADLGTGAAVIQGISAVVSLWLGGWVAGRLTPAGVRNTGWLHGFIVWCVATIAGVCMVTSGAGWALGDLSKIVGGGLSAAAMPAAAVAGGAADLAKDALKQSGDTLASFTEEAVGRRPADNQNPAGGIRAKREVGLALARLFTPGEQTNAAEARAAVVKALVDTTGLSEQEANQLVAEWTATYDRLKADLAAAKGAAETKARKAADEAAEALAVFSFCAFAALAFGAFAGSWGGCQGARYATHHEATVPQP